MDFDSLPNEILEKITFCLDGTTLFRAKQTCIRWKNMVKYAETSHILWKQLCVREMSADLLTELIGFDDGKVETIDYRDVYIKYKKQRSLKKTSDYLLTSFDFWEEHGDKRGMDCTCVRVKGDGLLTGHRNGSVVLSNTQTGIMPGVVTQHMRQVTDIVFLDNYTNELSSTSYHFLTASKDRTMQIVPSSTRIDNLRIHFRSYVKTIRVFGKKVAVLCANGEIILFEYFLGDELRMDKLYELPPIGRRTSRYNWMSFWNDTLTCISSSIDCYTSKVGERLWSCHPPSLVEDNVMPASEDVVAATGFLFRKNIVILITVDRYLLISNNGYRYRRYSTLKDLKGVVTSVALSGNLLALGTDIGHLFLYHFDNDSDLLDLQLDRPSWSEQLSKTFWGPQRAAIVDIDIKLDSKEPLIVAANQDEAFVVRFVETKSKQSIKSIHSS